jgi:hypothetical protein
MPTHGNKYGTNQTGADILSGARKACNDCIAELKISAYVAISRSLLFWP